MNGGYSKKIIFYDEVHLERSDYVSNKIIAFENWELKGRS